MQVLSLRRGLTDLLTGVPNLAHLDLSGRAFTFNIIHLIRIRTSFEHAVASSELSFYAIVYS